MSNCCTPEYIKIPSLSVSGDIVLKRGTGYAPSCGYYEYYSGTSGLNYYDYHEVNIEYNSGSGFWTFSGSSTGFDDSTIYRSVKTGTPCDPIGAYTGGFYDVSIQEANKFNVYDFKPGFIKYSDSDSNVPVGSGIHKDKDVLFKFSFKDINNSLKSIVYDVLNVNGSTIQENYYSGKAFSVNITEQENIKIFGSYRKDFGVRARVIDKYLGETTESQLYAYGNVLNIDSLSIQDKDGTTNWESKKDNVQAETLGVVPSGKISETVPQIKAKINLFDSLTNVNLSHLDLYASQDSVFETNSSNFKQRVPLINGSVSTDIVIDKTLNIETNKDYYFAAQASSNVGAGNTVKFGPHKIFEKEEVANPITANDVLLSFKGSSYLNEFRTGEVTENITGSSGIVDYLLINKEDFNQIKQVYREENYLYSTLPTNPSGKWKYTSFEYSFEFKDKDDDYSNLNKKIKLTATGTSTNPINSGMPLFQMTDDNTGVAVEISTIYNESGLYLICNTGHQYEYYKYKRDSF